MNKEDHTHWARQIDCIVRDTVFSLTHHCGLRSELMRPNSSGGVTTFESEINVSTANAEFRLFLVVSHTDDPVENVALELFDERDTAAKLWDESYADVGEFGRAMRGLNFFIAGYLEGLLRT